MTPQQQDIKLKVIVGCEESQIICSTFREKTKYEAYSCDIVPTRGKYPQWHIHDDILKHLDYHQYDIAIVSPPCDHLAVSGARWFAEKRIDGRQRKAIEFFMNIWESTVHSIAIENPVGIMSGKLEYIKRYYPDLYPRVKELPKPQIIQPWQFGHGETKATCLWLKNLPKLKPTNIVEGREARIHKMPPGKNRSRDRAVTYQGISDAMAEQWGAP
jgi:site-specific DNA-cytosine methylase